MRRKKLVVGMTLSPDNIAVLDAMVRITDSNRSAVVRSLIPSMEQVEIEEKLFSEIRAATLQFGKFREARQVELMKAALRKLA